jgi:cytochrome c-type biogenesis protein CcmH
MLFVLICAGLLLIVLASVGLPLLSGPRISPSRNQYDRAVYRDQLAEVERDLGRGVLTPAEAESARLEIQRRLLAGDPSAGIPPSEAVAGPAGSPRVAALLMLFVLVGAGGLYWRLGAPALPDTSFALQPTIPTEATAPPPEAADAQINIRQAAERLERRLRDDPSNAGGWTLYARTESLLGDWEKAADAYKHAIDLGLKSSDVFAGYGEMRVMAADGVVSPAAREAFSTALAADSTNAVARFYLAMADRQAGDERKAIDEWLDLAAGLPEDAQMRGEIARRIAEAAKSAGIDPPPLPKRQVAETPRPGPTPEQMQAAAAMPPAERAKMINGMIEQLAAKLREEPNDLDGWMRLGRAYFLRGEAAKAVDAYDHASALKPGDPGIELQIVAALLTGMKPGDPTPPRAIELLTDVAAVAPDAPEVLWYLGVVASHAGRTAEARDKWTRLLASLPANGEDARTVRAALGELKGK